MKNLFLLMGTQRSGTTLLSKALSTHPLIFVHNETWLPNLFRNLEPDEKALQERLHLFPENQRHIQGQDDSKAILGLKEPTLTYHMPQVLQALSFAKVVTIVRDPRGVVNSYIENGWGLGTNAYTGAVRWQNEVHTQMHFCHENPELTLLIRYEDLVSNMEETLKRVCTFLDVIFDPAMLEYHENRGYMKTSRESQHVNKPPSSTLSNKWRAALSSREIAIIETVCSRAMQRLDYQREHDDTEISLLERTYFNLHQKVVGEIQLQYRLLLVRFKHKWKSMNLGELP